MPILHPNYINFADYCLVKPPKENTHQIFLPKKILESKI